MNNWQQVVRNWTRPSIQLPRIITKTVKTMFTPITYPLGIVKEYWETWHSVYQPKGKEDVDK